MTVLPRGQCSVCLGMFAVLTDGNVRSHFGQVVHPDRDYQGNKCPGAGRPPRAKRPLWR